MPRIDFYLMQEKESKIRLNFACRIVEKAYRNKHKIYIHTEYEKDALYIDELLWTFKLDSFLPHNLIGEGPEPAPPIQIGFQQKPDKQHDILINLSNNVPDFYKKFTRVIELVNLDEEIQKRSREHYKLYRADGFQITTHKLAKLQDA
ncbi:DNA polymerase III subunit chi [Gammaproteobacteria bacterium]|nr:DNA polymerase III subunit chi [Gammaproteobacteria bacterium]